MPPNPTRRTFVKGLAAGSLLSGLGLWRSPVWAVASPGQPVTLTGREFDLFIGQTPVNITGTPRTAMTINGSLPGPLLRWREGDRFVTGPWTLGNKYKWMCPIACIWVAIVTIIFILPTTPAGNPFDDEFNWNAVNYAPIVTGGVMLAVTLWWFLGAKRTFTGPKHTIQEIDQEISV